MLAHRVLVGSVHRKLLKLCALLHLLLATSCGDGGSAVVVNVSPLPPQASSVKIMASLGDQVAPETYSLAIPKMDGKTDFTFSFHLDTDHASRNIVVAAAAVDAQGCTLAVGANAPVAAAMALAGLSVGLVSLSAPDCSDSVPRSLYVTPDQVSSEQGDITGLPATVRIIGWGFRPGVTVALAGQAATRVRFVSVIEVEAQVPQTIGMPRVLGPMSLSVTNPDGATDSRTDLLRRGYYATVALERSSTMPPQVRPSVVSDFNGDGQADLLAIDESKKAVAFYFCRADGTFPTTPSNLVSFPDVPLAIAVSDVTGDGIADLVVGFLVSRTPPMLTPTVGVLPGLGKGQTAATYASYLVGGPPTSILGLDVNRDGLTDLVVNTSLDAVSLLINQGHGLFPLAGTSYSAGGPVVSVLAQDVTADGRSDLIVSARTGSDPSGSVRVFPATNTFGDFSTIAQSPFRGIQADTVRALDLDGGRVAHRNCTRTLSQNRT